MTNNCRYARELSWDEEDTGLNRERLGKVTLGGQLSGPQAKKVAVWDAIDVQRHHFDQNWHQEVRGACLGNPKAPGRPTIHEKRGSNGERAEARPLRRSRRVRELEPD